MVVEMFAGAFGRVSAGYAKGAMFTESLVKSLLKAALANRRSRKQRKWVPVRWESCLPTWCKNMGHRYESHFSGDY